MVRRENRNSPAFVTGAPSPADLDYRLRLALSLVSHRQNRDGLAGPDVAELLSVLRGEHDGPGAA